MSGTPRRIGSFGNRTTPITPTSTRTVIYGLVPLPHSQRRKLDLDCGETFGNDTGLHARETWDCWKTRKQISVIFLEEKMKCVGKTKENYVDFCENTNLVFRQNDNRR